MDVNFSDEFIQYHSFFETNNSPVECLKKIKKLNITRTFPNVEITYRLFLTLPITYCLSDNSFSVLKRIKNRFRAAMSQNSLEAFSLLTIENDVIAKLDFDDVINELLLQRQGRNCFKLKYYVIYNLSITSVCFAEYFKNHFHIC